MFWHGQPIKLIPVILPGGFELGVQPEVMGKLNLRQGEVIAVETLKKVLELQRTEQ